MILSDLLLQVLQVLCVLLLAPLLQGFISRRRSAFSAAAGQASYSPIAIYGSSSISRLVVPDSASWIFFVAPIIAFTAMLTVPILIPVLTDRPLPLSDMGDMLGGGLILTLGSFAIILAGLEPAMYMAASGRAEP